MNTPVSKKKAAVKKAATKKKAVVKKKVVAKKAVVASKKASKKKASVKKANVKSLSYEKRYQMIAEAAYLIAEKQDFMPNNELRNWLKAEEQIDDWITRKKLKLKK